MKKKLLAVALVCCMAFGLSACGAKTPTVEQIQKNGELVMLTNAAFAPFEYMDGENVVGVDVDICQAIADELGVELKIVNMDFDPIVDYVKAGKGDLGAAGLSINEERAKEVDFSVEYVTSSQWIIVKTGTDVGDYSLEGKVVGVQQGTTGASLASAEDTKAKEVKNYKDAIAAAEDLKLDRVDCVVIDALPAQKIVEQNNGELACFDPGFEPESYAIAVQKGNTTLLEAVNKVLNELMAEGKIEEFVVNHSTAVNAESGADGEGDVEGGENTNK